MSSAAILHGVSKDYVWWDFSQSTAWEKLVAGFAQSLTVMLAESGTPGDYLTESQAGTFQIDGLYLRLRFSKVGATRGLPLLSFASDFGGDHGLQALAPSGVDVLIMLHAHGTSYEKQADTRNKLLSALRLALDEAIPKAGLKYLAAAVAVSVETQTGNIINGFMHSHCTRPYRKQDAAKPHCSGVVAQGMLRIEDHSDGANPRLESLRGMLQLFRWHCRATPERPLARLTRQTARSSTSIAPYASVQAAWHWVPQASLCLEGGGRPLALASSALGAALRRCASQPSATPKSLAGAAPPLALPAQHHRQAHFPEVDLAAREAALALDRCLLWTPVNPQLRRGAVLLDSMALCVGASETSTSTSTSTGTAAAPSGGGTSALSGSEEVPALVRAAGPGPCWGPRRGKRAVQSLGLRSCWGPMCAALLETDDTPASDGLGSYSLSAEQRAALDAGIAAHGDSQLNPTGGHVGQARRVFLYARFARSSSCAASENGSHVRAARAALGAIGAVSSSPMATGAGTADQGLYSPPSQGWNQAPTSLKSDWRHAGGPPGYDGSSYPSWVLPQLALRCSRRHRGQVQMLRLANTAIDAVQKHFNVHRLGAQAVVQRAALGSAKSDQGSAPAWLPSPQAFERILRRIVSKPGCCLKGHLHQTAAASGAGSGPVAGAPTVGQADPPSAGAAVDSTTADSSPADSLPESAILDPTERPPSSTLVDYALKLARAYSPLAASVQRLWRASSASESAGFGAEPAGDVGRQSIRAAERQFARKVQEARNEAEQRARRSGIGGPRFGAGADRDTRMGPDPFAGWSLSLPGNCPTNPRELKRHEERLSGLRVLTSGLNQAVTMRGHWSAGSSMSSSGSDGLENEARGLDAALPTPAELKACLHGLFARGSPCDPSVTSNGESMSRGTCPAGSLLALAAAMCSRMRGPRGMSAMWSLIAAEVRWYYESCIPLPFMPGGRGGALGPPLGMPQASATSGDNGSATDPADGLEVNISDSLLYQKLTVVQATILRKLARAKRYSCESTAGEAGSAAASGQAAESGGDSQAGLSTAGPSRGATGNPPRRGSLGPIPGMYLMSGSAMHRPRVQPAALHSDDRLAEEQSLFLSMDASSRAIRSEQRLANDMQAFQAANPGCTFEDFVRWHSPRDWIQDDDEDGDEDEVVVVSDDGDDGGNDKTRESGTEVEPEPSARPLSGVAGESGATDSTMDANQSAPRSGPLSAGTPAPSGASPPAVPEAKTGTSTAVVKGHLSERMQDATAPGGAPSTGPRSWQVLWGECSPLAADEQRPMTNDEREAETALVDLETLPLGRLLQGLASALAAAGLHSLEHRVPALLAAEDWLAAQGPMAQEAEPLGPNDVPASPIRSRLHRASAALVTAASLADAGLRRSLASRGVGGEAATAMASAVSRAAGGSPDLARRQVHYGAEEAGRSAVRECFARLIVAMEDAETLCGRIVEVFGALLPPGCGDGVADGSRGRAEAAPEESGPAGSVDETGGEQTRYERGLVASMPPLAFATARLAFRLCCPLAEYCPHSGGGATPTRQQRASRQIECADVPPEAKIRVSRRSGDALGQVASALQGVLADESEDTVLLQPWRFRDRPQSGGTKEGRGKPGSEGTAASGIDGGSGTTSDLLEAGAGIGDSLGLSHGEGHRPADRGELDPSYSLAWRTATAEAIGGQERAVVLASFLAARGSVLPGGSPGREDLCMPRPELLDVALHKGLVVPRGDGDATGEAAGAKDGASAGSDVPVDGAVGTTGGGNEDPHRRGEGTADFMVVAAHKLHARVSNRGVRVARFSLGTD